MKKTLLVLALAGFAGNAAADSLLYGGAMVGQSTYDGESSTSTEIHIGTGILPFLGLEAGYTDHGKFETSNNVDVKVKSFFAAARPSIDIGPFHIYGRVGLHNWDLDNSSGADDDGLDVMYGVGIEYFTEGPLAIGLGYNTYKLDDEYVGNLNLTATFHIF